MTVEKHNKDAGSELLSLLRQRRYLYHQLKMLNESQQLAKINSPEQVLEIVNGRRKLAEKLLALEERFRLISSGWQKCSVRLEPTQKLQAREMESETEKIIDEILSSAPADKTWNIPLQDPWKVDELLAEV